MHKASPGLWGGFVRKGSGLPCITVWKYHEGEMEITIIQAHAALRSIRFTRGRPTAVINRMAAEMRMSMIARIVIGFLL